MELQVAEIASLGVCRGAEGADALRALLVTEHSEFSLCAGRTIKHIATMPFLCKLTLQASFSCNIY
jgi:hypothetical protein